MSIGSGIAYAAFWFGLFGTICWFLWLVHSYELEELRVNASRTYEEGGE